MAENKPAALPQFESLQALTDYFDTHDIGEHLDHLGEAEFEVDMQRRQYFVAIDAELMKKVVAIAKSKQVSPEMLIHDWLQEQTLNAT
jgi:hypothetical protein